MGAKVDPAEVAAPGGDAIDNRTRQGDHECLYLFGAVVFPNLCGKQGDVL